MNGVDRETGEVFEMPNVGDATEFGPDRIPAAVVPFVRSAYNYDRDSASLDSGFKTVGPSMTQQQFAEEVDINTIVHRFGLTGELPENVRVPQSGDFSSVTDFQSAMNVVRQAEESFMQMPADVRAEFNNDPARFVAFVEDPDNRARAEKLGIVVPRETPKPPEPMLVKVVPEDPPTGGRTSST